MLTANKNRTENMIPVFLSRFLSINKFIVRWYGEINSEVISNMKAITANKMLSSPKSTGNIISFYCSNQISKLNFVITFLILESVKFHFRFMNQIYQYSHKN